MSAAAERRARRRARLQADPSVVVHGSASTYTNWACRCTECRTAWTQACLGQRAKRTARLASGDAVLPHGSDSTYVNWSCRCRPCTDAHSAQRLRQARQKAGVS